ncbi:hypothetical protein PVK06_008361 [Gossypium arboreum]|uniref:Poly(A) RNA polymerase mitochondrial-like central palm domain-containing protein n=1 Tax=Gossypium arboreum TaxID=29729 RepID=A0ABR0QJT0_GOSAR|nr:hypothetical protein PVK06_008361 [Gossypium arboreum]
MFSKTEVTFLLLLLLFFIFYFNCCVRRIFLFSGLLFHFAQIFLFARSWLKDYCNCESLTTTFFFSHLHQFSNTKSLTQALTRARVPIVKLMDPVTRISCDICVNNLFAVVNTRLLRDYAKIDVRLQQLAFIVKHWAKTRGVNARPRPEE